MSAGAWIPHDRFKLYKNNGTINLLSDAFELRLYAGTSDVDLKSTTNAPSDELVGNGYSANTLTTSLTIDGSVVTFGALSASFTASGGNITARYAAVIDTTSSNEVIAHMELDSSGADVIIADGVTRNITFPNGIYQEV